MVGIGRTPPTVGPARGDVHFMDFPDLGGHVTKGVHAAVIVRTDRMQRSATVILVAMTSAPRSASENPRYLVAIRGKESGLPRDGYIKCDQIATFPTTLLGPKAGRLNPAAMDRVDQALRFVLGV